MKLTMLLCDHVAVAEGKLYINGGGWNETGPGPSPSGIAVMIEVPWVKTNRSITFKIRLLHEDGHPIHQDAPLGAQPVEISADFEVGRPAGTPEGAAIPVSLPINLPPLFLEPGQSYYWEASVDDEKREEWRLSFRTRRHIGPQASTDPTAIPPM